MTTYTTSGLTTAFTPAPSCYSSGVTGTAWAYTFAGLTTTVNYNHDDACYPYSTSLPYSYGTFSPGMCPGGYTTALHDLARGVVTAACCPSNYDALTYGAYCTSKRTTSISIDCLYTDSELSPSPSPTCTPGLVGPGNAVQFAVHVVYASSDLSEFPSGYTPGSIGDHGLVTAPAFTEHVPGATPTSVDTGGLSTPGPTGSHSGTSDPTAVADGGRDGLPGGAKAGIGIGVAVGVLALVGVLLVLLRRRRGNRRGRPKEAGAAHESDAHYRFDDKEVVGSGYEYASNPPRGDEQYHSELDGRASAPINELAGGHVQEQRAQELPHSTPTLNTPPPTHDPYLMLHTTPAPIASAQTASAQPAGDFNAIAFGPVSTQLDHDQQNRNSGPASGCLPPPPAASPPPPASPSASNNAQQQVTVEDVELKYLEDEERRIRERKEAILASRRGV